MSSILGNTVGGGGGSGKTFIIEDETGAQFMAVVVDEMTVFDAKPKDVKIGKTFVSDSGVGVGEDTKTYHVMFASYLIFPGETFSIPLEESNLYDYTQFQAMISQFNTTFFDSTITDKLSLYDAVYNVNSIDKISDVTKNTQTKTIDLNIINDTEFVYVIHFNLYREE